MPSANDVKEVLAAAGGALPKAVVTYRPQSKYWAVRFPDGITLQLGIGTVALAGFILTLLTLAAMDYLAPGEEKRSSKPQQLKAMTDLRDLYLTLTGGGVLPGIFGASDLSGLTGDALLAALFPTGGLIKEVFG